MYVRVKDKGIRSTAHGCQKRRECVKGLKRPCLPFGEQVLSTDAPFSRETIWVSGWYTKRGAAFAGIAVRGKQKN